MQTHATKLERNFRPSAIRPTAAVVPIESRITILRHQKVILDTALAEIYGVPVKRLNEQTKRNRKRFPADFMFQLTPSENKCLRSQFATTKNGRGGRRSLAYAFTEHGAIMAATVLSSERAVQMSVFVVRAFVRLRQMLAANREFADQIKELEKHLATHDGAIQEIIRVIRKLMSPPPNRRTKIGFALPPARAL
ncbi:MAG: ORF6N domain-containing protein [Bryobacteraceae bacterium]